MYKSISKGSPFYGTTHLSYTHVARRTLLQKFTSKGSESTIKIHIKMYKLGKITYLFPNLNTRSTKCGRQKLSRTDPNWLGPSSVLLFVLLLVFTHDVWSSVLVCTGSVVKNKKLSGF